MCGVEQAKQETEAAMQARLEEEDGDEEAGPTAQKMAALDALDARKKYLTLLRLA
jgi:hypothetical protein